MREENLPIWKRHQYIRELMQRPTTSASVPAPPRSVSNLFPAACSCESSSSSVSKKLLLVKLRPAEARAADWDALLPHFARPVPWVSTEPQMFQIDRKWPNALPSNFGAGRMVEPRQSRHSPTHLSGRISAKTENPGKPRSSR